MFKKKTNNFDITFNFSFLFLKVKKKKKILNTIKNDSSICFNIFAKGPFK